MDFKKKKVRPLSYGGPGLWTRLHSFRAGPDIEHDVDLAANLLEDDYSLTIELVNRRVIIHTLSV
jgi:hypothetical protein